MGPRRRVLSLRDQLALARALDARGPQDRTQDTRKPSDHPSVAITLAGSLGQVSSAVCRDFAARWAASVEWCSGALTRVP